MKVKEYRDDLRERVVRIETVIGESLPRMDAHLGKIEQHLGNQNDRIRTLEYSKVKLYTIAGVISFLTPIILKAFDVI